MKYKNILLAACFIFGTTACQKDFLEKEPSDLLTLSQIRENAVWSPDVMLGSNLGATATTFKSLQTTGGSHDDFAQKSFDIQMDLLSGNIELGGSNYPWFRPAAQLNAGESTSDYTYAAWRIYYKLIFMTNSAFDRYGSDTEMPKEASGLYDWGQAKILRAYSYFNLANIYARHYDLSKNDEILPIYRTTKAGKVEKPQSIAKVYELIIQDLNQGIEALNKSGIARQDKSVADATVGACYLAYAYLQTGQNAKAYEVAKSVIDAGIYPLISANNIDQTGFNNIGISEFIWGINITSENTGQLVTFWGHMDVYTMSYAAVGDAKLINGNLQASIPEYDLRGRWFSPNGYPIGKFYTDIKEYNPNTGERLTMADRSWESDIHFMRTAEMYLVAMEAAARMDKLTEAKSVLKALLKERTVADKYEEVAKEIDGLNKEQLLNTIFYNWNIEMWGEGKSLMTMKRFKKSVARTNRSVYHSGVTISYDDPRLVYKLPARELANNPYIGE